MFAGSLRPSFCVAYFFLLLIGTYVAVHTWSPSGSSYRYNGVATVENDGGNHGGVQSSAVFREDQETLRGTTAFQRQLAKNRTEEFGNSAAESVNLAGQVISRIAPLQREHEIPEGTNTKDQRPEDHLKI